MTPERAREILCNPAMTRAAIKRAAANVTLANHPDTATEAADLTFKEIQDARACLLSLVERVENACKMCGGSGLIRSARCMQCKGTGVK